MTEYEYYVEYPDGRSRLYCGGHEETALYAIWVEYPEAVYGEWEVSYADWRTERMLVWPDDETAGPEGTGDDGSHAIAEILRASSV